MPISPGARLGPYEILAPIGAGGMGEVWKARDTRLSRLVAIKVLPEALSRDPERAARFEREARSASALSHAHVVAVYDVGRSEDVLYIVTEIVEGGDLRSLLSRGRLPLRRGVDLAAQIASGLAAAHDRGIVHRDLKPENVLIGTNGDAKIGDFGLAKLTESTSGGSSQLPTSDGLKTTDGIVMGTVAYMSPEQGRGDALDFRSDQFAFGSLLYEMLSGRPSFRRASAAETLSAIIRDEPEPLGRIDPSIPPTLSWIVARCLAKDPQNRYASTRDLASELDLVREHWSELTGRLVGAPAAAPVRRRARALGLALGAVAVLAAALVAAQLARRSASTASPAALRFIVPPPAASMFASRFDAIGLAFSPDGSRLAFLADATESTRDVVLANRLSRGIWIRDMSALEPRPLAGTEGASSIFWSPDGRSIGFFAEGQLRRHDLGSGAPVPICEVPAHGLTVAATWGEGEILFASSFEGVIYRAQAEGSRAPTALLRPDRAKGQMRLAWPHFLPDGRSFLYVATTTAGTGRLMVASLDSSPPRDLGPVGSRVEYCDPGLIVFARDGALVAQRFDPKSKTLHGPLLSVAPSVYYFYTSKWAGFTVSRNGSLACHPQGNVSRLTWFDRSGRSLGDIGTGGGETIGVSISPDGRSAAFDRTRSDLGTFDVWRIDLARGVETRLTSEPNTEFDPVWLPDGGHLVYSVVQGSLPQLVRRDLATGVEEPLLSPGTFQQALDVTPDGSRLLFSQSGKKSGWGIWTLSLNGPASPTPVLVSDHVQEIGRLSPDGKFVAYISDESGRQEVYVSTMGSGAPGARVSTTGAGLLRWSRDGKELFYTSSSQQLFAAPITTSPSLQIGTPRPLFSLPPSGWRAFDVTADGRFLASVPESTYATQPLRVAVSWTSEIPK